MKITYEFDNCEDRDERLLFENATNMHSALCDIRDYLRNINKGYIEDTKEQMIKKIHEYLWDSKMEEIP